MKTGLFTLTLTLAIMGALLLPSCTGINNYGQSVIEDVRASAGSVVGVSGFSAGAVAGQSVRSQQSQAFWGSR